MNADSFVKYLKDGAFLHQISYQELKTLSLQYPYCQNLHLLLLKKSYLDNNEEWENNLERAATYSFDRTQLFHQMQAMEQDLAPEDTFLLSEEYLELKDLSKAEPERPPSKISEEEALPARQEEIPRPEPALGEESFEQSNEEEEKGLELELPEAINDEPATTLPSASDPTTKAEIRFQVSPELIEELIVISELWPMPGSLPAKHPTGTNHEAPSSASVQLSLLSRLQQRDARQLRKSHAPSPPPEMKPKPRPKGSFKSWLRQFQEPDVKGQLEDIMEYKKLEEVKKKKKKKKKQYQMPPIAVKSITENDEVASETLAEILIEQGRYEKAIQMYNRLVLLFPEKSSYFAAKINNLKSA